MLQGLALGGEYGGAATYVAEHAPPGKRGFFTSWIQTTATLGLFLSLLVILGCRIALGPEPSTTWGWRIPFLLSLILLAVSVYIRLKLNESPVFKRMKAEGKASKAPLTESFLRWGNLKIVLLVLFGGVAGQAVVWYTGHVLRALLPPADAEGRPAQPRTHGGRRRSSSRTPFFIVFGDALRQDRPQADHHARLRARRAHLLPDLQGAHQVREPAPSRPRRRQRRSRWSPTRTTAASSSTRSARRKFTDVLRPREGLPRQEGRSRTERGRAGGHHRHRQDRRAPRSRASRAHPRRGRLQGAVRRPSTRRSAARSTAAGYPAKADMTQGQLRRWWSPALHPGRST